MSFSEDYRGNGNKGQNYAPEDAASRTISDVAASQMTKEQLAQWVERQSKRFMGRSRKIIDMECSVSLDSASQSIIEVFWGSNHNDQNCLLLIQDLIRDTVRAAAKRKLILPESLENSTESFTLTRIRAEDFKVLGKFFLDLAGKFSDISPPCFA